MDTKEREEIKKELQLERMILFSDAVFAIIITIMVLELRIPEGLRHADAEKIKEALLEVLPKFCGYIVSFFIVGAFWMNHLKLFSYLKDYTTRLIVYNLMFLFFISLFPFAVTIMTETISPRNLNGLYVYFSLAMFALLMQTFLTGYIVRNARELCINPHEIEKNLQWKAQRLNYIVIPMLFVFTTIGFIAGFPPGIFSFGFMLWALLLGSVRKKYYPKTTENDKAPVLARLFRSRKKTTHHIEPQLVELAAEAKNE